MNSNTLKEFLDRKVDEYNQPFFIKDDPISVPHLFHDKQDREIAGLFAAIFAWGNRTTIIRKSTELMQQMEMRPYQFCLEQNPEKLKKVLGFKHRTFNDTDLLYFLEFLHAHYQEHESLQNAFTMHGNTVEEMLIGFHHYFFSLEHVPSRTKKHIATPERGSTCKRLNMFLRWMVRTDDRGVDFGIWKNIDPALLICPIDLHVARVARKLKLISRKQTDWYTALELTDRLREFNPSDPARYDFALYTLGMAERF